MSKPMSVNQSLLQAREADSVDPDTGTKFAWHALYSRAFFLSGQEVLVTLGPAGHLCLDQVRRAVGVWEVLRMCMRAQWYVI